ncbi:MAG: fumarate hydratase [Candidatus Fermentibacteraceae bacterium]|nr:fumarate hydratase [Candidatus Fermentibacteraceae bacterium]MBN2608379.1 fumarate hydratase [Candidatus Fermentibacteraceae bacterium]
MRELDVAKVTEAVRDLCIDTNIHLPDDVKKALRDALAKEESPLGREILQVILDNHDIAEKERMPICQDTGAAIVFLEVGQDVHLTGGALEDAVNEGVRKGYADGYLRKSMVGDPVMKRKNTTDNTPAIIHTRIVPGDRVRITFAPKGGGAENMSEVRMMTAADGIEGVKNFVVDRVSRSGGNPCPPIVVGVGIGGSFEKCAMLAKEALLRPIGEPNPDPEFDRVEKELLRRVNNLGIGPQGLGGRTTALAVHIRTVPCHIASMPVAVNIQCHASRHGERSI